MREIKRLTGREVFFHCWPQLQLRGIAEQIANDGAAFQRRFDLEQRLAGHKAVGDGLVPRLGVLTLAHDHVDAIVTLIERLPGPLYAIANNGDRFVLQDSLCFGQWKFFAGDDIFYRAAKV